MTAKEWLKRAYNLDKEIDKLIEEQQKAYDKACGVTRAGVQEERVQMSKCDMTADWIIAYIEYTEQIEQHMAELWKIKREIFNVITKIENNTLRQLLICRYIMFMKWERAAEELGFKDVRHVHRLHNLALRKAGEVIPLPDKT